MLIDFTSSARSFDGFAFGPSFEAEIDRILSPLKHTLSRVSLFGVRVGAFDQMRTLALTRLAFTRMIGPTGPLPDGGTGVLYAGPRPQGLNGDQKLERWMVDELKLTIFRHQEFHDADTVDLTALHCSLDALSSAREIIDDLICGPSNCRRCVPLQLPLNPP